MKSYDFIKPDPTLQNNLMAFGYDCGKGWHPLIEQLFDKIQLLLETTSSEYKDNFQIMQVKEKFGTLRVYVSGGSEEIYNLLDEYEALSAYICEKCGEYGNLIEINGWWSTLCNKCRGLIC